MAPFSTSERYALSWADARKIARLIVVAALGAGLNEFVKQVSNIDFAQYQELANAIGVVLGSAVVETLRRYLADFSHG